MAQMDGMRRRSSSSPKTPKARTSPTFEQLLQAGDSTRWPTSSSPTSGRDQDEEDDHGHHYKKSVLTKVKERAKKLRNTLSKKKHDHDDNVTPSWGVSLNDEEENEDPEYLGAPMYESELAPEGYKETARQHPRAVPVVPQEHVLPTSDKHEAETETHNLSNPNKTITETVTERLGPAYAAVSDPTHTIASKISGLTISTPAAQDTVSSGTMSENREQSQTWDKGVSVKEYLMNKLEPGEDEKALSRVITEAISPKKGPSDMGIVEKVREAVTSLLHIEESSQSRAGALSSSSPIPVSIHAHEVVEEENQGRRLQAN